ncbi:hypothetical protein [Spirosoma aerophilum]
MNTQEITIRVIAISRQYNEMALFISKKLSTALDNNEIDFSHFLSLNANLVQPLIMQSTKMVFDTSISVVADVEKNFQRIEEGSTALKKQINQLGKIEKLIEVAANVLTTAALVTTFIAAPNPASALAAVSSVGKLVGSLKKEDDDKAA